MDTINHEIAYTGNLSAQLLRLHTQARRLAQHNRRHLAIARALAGIIWDGASP